MKTCATGSVSASGQMIMIDVEPCRYCGAMCRSDDCGSVLVLKGHTWEAITIHMACRACVERYHDSVRRMKGRQA